MHADLTKHDHLRADGNPECNHKNGWVKEKEYQMVAKEANQHLAYLQEFLGIKKPLYNIFDAMASRICHGKQLPCSGNGKCLTNEDYFKTESIQGRLLEASHSHPDNHLYRLNGVLKELVENLSEPQKIHFYSAHDSTMSVLAGYFGVKGYLWPSFASNMVIEVWETDGADVVRIFYNGQLFKYMPLNSLTKKLRKDMNKKCI